MIAFCDIDGVLADFNKRAFEVLGLHLPTITWRCVPGTGLHTLGLIC